MDNLTEYRLDEITCNLEKLTARIGDYIDSNEARMRNVERTVTELQISQKNYMWFFGIVLGIISLGSNIILRLL